MNDSSQKVLFFLFHLDLMADGLCHMHRSIGRPRDEEVLRRRVKRMIRAAVLRAQGNRGLLRMTAVRTAWGTLLGRASLRRARRDHKEAIRLGQWMADPAAWDEGVD